MAKITVLYHLHALSCLVTFFTMLWSFTITSVHRTVKFKVIFSKEINVKLNNKGLPSYYVALYY